MIFASDFLPGPLGDFESGDPWVWTPSAVDAELHRILAVIDNINADVSAAQKAGKITGAEWNTWRGVYLAAHDFLTTASTLWGSNVTTARQHEQEAAKWRALVQSRGQKVSGPADLTRQEPESGISYWTIGLTLAGVAAVAFGALALKKRLSL